MICKFSNNFFFFCIISSIYCNYFPISIRMSFTSNDSYAFVISFCMRYVYLGVPFTSSRLFLDAAKNACRKTRMGIGNVRSIMLKSKIWAWDAKLKLYYSVIIPTLLYATEVFGLQHTDMLMLDLFTVITYSKTELQRTADSTSSCHNPSLIPKSVFNPG